jgi:hypothetical protein
MLLTLNRRTSQAEMRSRRARFRAQSTVAALLRQDINMNPIKREKWTEADVDAFPAGEHDYFDRKSGRLCDKPDDLQGSLAKALSAFANSGGGHLILGVDDAGVPDGVPLKVGRTPIRDWLEQKIPHLVEYALADFRVHRVEPSAPSRIPANREVIVIDIGDSALAPHQCNYGGGDARKYAYYHRQGGRSEPAPHFYLELLRQRLVNPVVEAKLVRISPDQIKRTDDGAFFVMRLHFTIENTGRVAAYKWQLQIREMDGYAESRIEDYRFSTRDFPQGMSFRGGIRVDDTILPGCTLEEDRHFGLLLRPQGITREALRAELVHLLTNLTLGHRLATETSPGELRHVELRTVLDLDALVEFLVERLKEA